MLAKLRSQTAMDHDRRHLKAAKALVIVIPLFGFTYILTFIGPDEVSVNISKHSELNRLSLILARLPPGLHHISVIQSDIPVHHGLRHHFALLLLQQ